MTLAAHGFHAICFNSETSIIPTVIIYKLTFRFKHIVLLYDADKTGIESAMKHEKALSEYGVKRLVLPLSGEKTDKDITFFFQAEDGIRDLYVTGVQTCALPILSQKSLTMSPASRSRRSWVTRRGALSENMNDSGVSLAHPCRMRTVGIL